MLNLLLLHIASNNLSQNMVLKFTLILNNNILYEMVQNILKLLNNVLKFFLEILPAHQLKTIFTSCLISGFCLLSFIEWK